MEKDWYFSDENGICHFRSAGLLIRNNKILLQHVKNEYALPGGHVKFVEMAEASLIREFKEEIGADISCDRMIWVEENFWMWEGTRAHGLAFYYLVSLKNSSNIPDDFARYSRIARMCSCTGFQ